MYSYEIINSVSVDMKDEVVYDVDMIDQSLYIEKRVGHKRLLEKRNISDGICVASLEICVCEEYTLHVLNGRLILMDSNRFRLLNSDLIEIYSAKIIVPPEYYGHKEALPFLLRSRIYNNTIYCLYTPNSTKHEHGILCEYNANDFSLLKTHVLPRNRALDFIVERECIVVSFGNQLALINTATDVTQIVELNKCQSITNERSFSFSIIEDYLFVFQGEEKGSYVHLFDWKNMKLINTYDLNKQMESFITDTHGYNHIGTVTDIAVLTDKSSIAIATRVGKPACFIWNYKECNVVEKLIKSHTVSTVIKSRGEYLLASSNFGYNVWKTIK